jgi:hypothetical protein
MGWDAQGVDPGGKDCRENKKTTAYIDNGLVRNKRRVRGHRKATE